VRDLRGSGRLRRTVIGVVIGAALLSGCSEKQEANDTLPSTSAAPTTEALAEVGPADFPVPDEARTKDAAGAEAFLRYWIDLMNHQRAIPAGQPLRDLGPECQECLRIARNYDEAAAAGNRYDGGELRLIDVAPPVIGGDEASINFNAGQAAVSLVDPSGVVINGLPAENNLGSGISLVWTDAEKSWAIAGFNIG
jgi:hypothetical protein